jgi:tetratricopeptide (TPR) repeat protein
MAANSTLFMTSEESARIQKTLQDRVARCEEERGQPWETTDRKAMVQHATSSSLMQDFASAVFGSAPKKEKDTMVAYAVGRPYPPCTKSVKDLKPMKLADLRMDTHHRGQVLAVRRISPVVELTASSWAVVQGESPDDIAQLEVFLHKTKRGRDVLDSGYDFLIKEPFYTRNDQDDFVIRVDHPTDIYIDSVNDDPEAWRDANTPSGAVETSPVTCKEKGNAALGKQQFAQAYLFYTKGLELAEKENDPKSTLPKDLHRNRAHVNLLLQRLDEAKADALASLTNGEDDAQKELDAKAYFRAGSAAYANGDYNDAKHFFQEQEKRQPDSQNAKIYLRRIEKRLEERATGIYDLGKIIASLPKVKDRPDVASYYGPTEVKDSPGAGRGLFATRKIKAKEVIMCERAFCLVTSKDRTAFSAINCDLREDAAIKIYPAGLHKDVVQKLLNNPSQVENFLNLWGEYPGLGTNLLEVDGSPVVDTFQVHDIIQRNAFGPGPQSEDEDVSNASTGVWVRAAYLNHTCDPNVGKEFLGDILILRAMRDIAAGEELTHHYDTTSDYDARMAALQRTWGFTCTCKLCKVEAAEPAEVRKKRRELEKESHEFAQHTNPSSAKIIAVTRAKRLRQAIADTYDAKKFAGLPQRALEVIDHWLTIATARR